MREARQPPANPADDFTLVSDSCSPVSSGHLRPRTRTRAEPAAPAYLYKHMETLSCYPVTRRGPSGRMSESKQGPQPPFHPLVGQLGYPRRNLYTDKVPFLGTLLLVY